MRIFVTGVTVSVVVALGLLLKWSIDTDRWMFVFPLVIAATVYGYFLVTDVDERRRGNKEVYDSIRSLFTFWYRRR